MLLKPGRRGTRADLSGRFRHGLFFPDEGHLNRRVALKALARQLQVRGAAFHLGVEADPTTVHGDIIIDCRGLAARDRMAGLGGVRGEMLIVRSRDIALTRPVRLLHPRIPLYVAPRGEGVHMIGATMIETDEKSGISVRSTQELLNAAFADAEILEAAADRRPAFADNLPKLVRRGRTLLANGPYRHGFLLSPALARMAANAVDNPEAVPEFMETTG